MAAATHDDVKEIKEDGFSVQHDWQKSFALGKDKFFVNFKKFGEASSLYNFDCENGEIKLDAESQCKAEKNGKRLFVQLDNSASRTFIAPKLEYETIHKGGIYSVDVSCTENLCVSSDTTGQLAVWETSHGNKVRDLEGHAMDVYKCRFFPSGLVVLSAGMDMTVRIFSVEDGWNARTMIGHKGPVHDIGILGEGEDVVSCSKDGTLKIWNCGSGKPSQEWAPDCGHLNALSISDTDLHLISTAAEMQKAFVYDNRTSETAFEFDTHGNSTAIAFDSGMRLFVGNDNGQINVYDLRTKKQSMVIHTQRGRVNKLLKSLGHIVSAFNDGTVAAYSPLSGEPMLEFTGSDCDPVYDISANNSTLFSACRDKVIRKYSLD